MIPRRPALYQRYPLIRIFELVMVDVIGLLPASAAPALQKAAETFAGPGEWRLSLRKFFFLDPAVEAHIRGEWANVVARAKDAGLPADTEAFAQALADDWAAKNLYPPGEPLERDAVAAGKRNVAPVPRQQRTRAEGGTIPNAYDVPAADAARIARRALALTAVTGRSLLEREDRNTPGLDRTLNAVREWLDRLGLDSELEPAEREIIARPLGALSPPELASASWIAEGLVVLAWSLAWGRLPPDDECVDPHALVASMGILDGAKAAALQSSANRRALRDLERYEEHVFAVHWRLREFSARPGPLDLVRYAETSWFGLRVDSLRLIEGDLAIGAAPISRAPADALRRCTRTVSERHRAIRWLLGWSPRFSDVDTST